MLLATDHTGLERFFELLASVLAEFGSVDLKTFGRQGEKRRFWDEMKVVSSARNDVVHKGNEATEETAAMAVAVAETLLDVLLPKILGNLGLRLQAGRLRDSRSETARHPAYGVLRRSGWHPAE